MSIIFFFYPIKLHLPKKVIPVVPEEKKNKTVIPDTSVR